MKKLMESSQRCRVLAHRAIAHTRGLRTKKKLSTCGANADRAGNLRRMKTPPWHISMRDTARLHLARKLKRGHDCAGSRTRRESSGRRTDRSIQGKSANYTF